MDNQPSTFHNEHVEYEEVEEGEEQIVYCDTEFHGEPHTEYVIDNSYFTQDNIYQANQDHSVCHFCKEDLSNKRFYVHLFDHHGFTKQQCEMMKQAKRLENSKGRPSTRRKVQKIHECPTCGLEFITKTGLTSHLKKKGPCSVEPERPSDGSLISNIVCPSYGCDRTVSTYMDLAIHVDTDHRDLSTITDSFRIRRVTLPDRMKFERWKKEMEAATSSEFFLRTSQKVTFAHRTKLYKCLFSNSRGQSKGRRCEQCPAFIKVCERTHGQYEVVACFGHLGHEHPTETAYAKSQRIAKYREIDNYHEARMHNERSEKNPEDVDEEENLEDVGDDDEPHVLVDEYGNPNGGMMILVPQDVVQQPEEQEDVARFIDDADDEIVGPRGIQKASAPSEVYTSQNQPGPSGHY